MSRKRIPHEVDTAAIEENAQSPEMAIFAKTLNALLVEKMCIKTIWLGRLASQREVFHHGEMAKRSRAFR